MGEIGQGCRDGPCEAVATQSDCFQGRQLFAELNWDVPTKLVVVQSHCGQADTGAQVHRNVPEKELSFKSSLCRRRRRPRLDGISPWSQLKLRFSVLRNVRFLRAGESSPVSPLPSKFSATTRAGLHWLHVMPSQVQKWLLAFQEASARAPPSLSCPLKASKAASLPACTVVAAWMVTSNHSKLMTPIAIFFLVWLPEMAVTCCLYP